MKHNLFMATLTLGLFGAGALLDADDAQAQVSSTVGSVRGIIRDKSNGEPAAGATVVATSPSLQGSQVGLTDDGGQYFITSLPPGLYLLTVYYADATFSRGNVFIQVGKQSVVNVTVDTTAATGKPRGETIQITGTAPIVDQGSTKTGVTLNDKYTRNIPTGRTFGGSLGAASGSQDDFYGVSIGGATSVENTYIIEGINTTDTGVGTLSSNLPNEFIEETEVITGGYNAEFGRATGGIVNVVTKQGSNEVHGSVFGYLKPGALVSDAKLIQAQGGSIDTKDDLDYSADLGAELGGPIIKDKLWFHLGFNPSFVSSTITRLVQSQIDEDGDGEPDVGSDGFTKHIPVAGGRTEQPTSIKTYYFTGKLNGAISANHQYQLSLFGNPRVSDDTYNTTFVPSPLIQLRHETVGAYDAAAKWSSKLDKGKTEIDAVAGFHRGYGKQSAPNAFGNRALVTYAYERSLYDFSDLEGGIDACRDGGADDRYMKIRNCPVQNYTESGLGLLEDRTNDRISTVVSATRRVRAGGYHLVKAGIDLEVSTYNSNTTYTGDAFYQRFCNTDADGNCSDDPGAAPGPWQSVGYSHIIRNLTPEQLADPKNIMLGAGEELCSGGRAVCTATPSLIADTTDRSIGAYLQDSWQLLPYLTINAGLRFEQQRGEVARQLQGTIGPSGEKVPKVAFTLDNWAPRLGFIFDPSKEGKSKLFGHWGRFYENIPMDLNVRGFGGEIDKVGLINGSQRSSGAPGYDANCNVDHAAGTDPALALAQCSDSATQALLGGGTEYVTPGLKGQYSEELILGVEYEIASDVTVGLNYVHRTLPSVIEDVLTPSGEYFITNPGQDLSKEAADLHAQAAALMASGDPRAGLYEYRATQLERLGLFDKPVRNYDAVAVSLKQRPTDKSLILATYTYSKTIGNFPGLFSTETNQLNPNGTSQYDLPALLANRYGLLGLDRTHNLKIDAFYQFDLKAIGSLTVGGSVRAESGIPHNALGSDPVYGVGEAYLLPRGSFQRSPVTGEADVHLAFGRRLSKTTALEAFVNVFNLFNRQDELTTDENYTFDPTLPIVGGDKKDLEHLKALTPGGVETASTVHQNPNFGSLNTRQSPRNVQVGFRLTF